MPTSVNETFPPLVAELFARNAAVATARRQTLFSKLLYGAGGLFIGRASCPPP